MSTTHVSRLSGKHIVITGASAGIGAELARQLSAHGCRLTLAARRAELLDQVAVQVCKAGGQAVCAVCDVTSREQVLALAVTARGAFGEPDVWVNNAGRGIMHRVLEATEEDMLAQFRLNCLSSLWAYQAVVPAWLQRGSGQMIDIASVAGKTGFAFSAGYCVAKHGLSGLGDTIRQELAGSGIMFTTVYPGPTVSDFGKAREKHTTADIENALRSVRTSRGPLASMLAAQPTDYVARRIVGVMLRLRPTLYLHPGATFGALVANFWPGFIMTQLSRFKPSKL